MDFRSQKTSSYKIKFWLSEKVVWLLLLYTYASYEKKIIHISVREMIN